MRCIHATASDCLFVHHSFFINSPRIYSHIQFGRKRSWTRSWSRTKSPRAPWIGWRIFRCRLYGKVSNSSGFCDVSLWIFRHNEKKVAWKISFLKKFHHFPTSQDLIYFPATRSGRKMKQTGSGISSARAFIDLLLRDTYCLCCSFRSFIDGLSFLKRSPESLVWIVVKADWLVDSDHWWCNGCPFFLFFNKTELDDNRNDGSHGTSFEIAAIDGTRPRLDSHPTRWIFKLKLLARRLGIRDWSRCRGRRSFSMRIFFFCGEIWAVQRSLRRFLVMGSFSRWQRKRRTSECTWWWRCRSRRRGSSSVSAWSRPRDCLSTFSSSPTSSARSFAIDLWVTWRRRPWKRTPFFSSISRTAEFPNGKIGR